MPIYDTSSVIDTTVFMRSEHKKNMVGDNYYIENLQDVRDRDWKYRYNIIDLEEENEKITCYQKDEPVFTLTEAAITSVKTDTGEKLSSDWGRLTFQQLKHPCKEGKRFRFARDYSCIKDMSAEEKKSETSVWIAVNKNTISPGNSCVIRRCNGTIMMVGAGGRDRSAITESHEEPCILETEMKYTEFYTNITLPIPQAEWYMTMQLNYFTNYIQINDRIMFGIVDPEYRDNNHVYKVKAVVKSTSEKTYIQSQEEGIENTALVILALDRDVISEKDDPLTKIANNAPIYPTADIPVPGEYSIDICSDVLEENGTLTLGQTANFLAELMSDGVPVQDVTFTFSGQIENVDQAKYTNYFTLISTDINTCSVKNKKACTKGKFILTATCESPNGETVTKTFSFTLGNFY